MKCGDNPDETLVAVAVVVNVGALDRDFVFWQAAGGRSLGLRLRLASRQFGNLAARLGTANWTDHEELYRHCTMNPLAPPSRITTSNVIRLR